MRRKARLGTTEQGQQMSRNKADHHAEAAEMADRLQQLKALLDTPTMVSPRTPADDAPEGLPSLIDVDPHPGRMYVAGREPHFRTVTLLQRPHAPRRGDQPG